MGVQEIYDKLRTAPQHRASSVELFDEMTLQAGDVVTVSSDGQNYSVPIYSQDIHWTGAGMTVLENTGNEKREPLKAQKRRDFATNKRGYGNSKRQDGTDKWIEDFENTDLWVNQDTIWAVSGAYQVWTDPVSGVKHIQLKDGALLEVDRGDGVYSTVGTSYGIAQVNNEVVNVIEGSALWTQRNNITGVCGEFTVITDTQTGKKRLKIANGTGLVMTRNQAEYGVYDDGNLTAGVIATIVNGETSTYIKGSKIYIGNESTTTVISGLTTRISNLETDCLRTKNLYAAIANLENVNVKALTFASASSERGGISVSSVSTTSLTLGGVSVGNGLIIGASVSGNTLTLTPLAGNAITFSKAITLTGVWSNGTYTVTPDPLLGTPIGTTIGKKGESWSGNTCTVTVGYENPISGAMISTGCSFEVDASGRDAASGVPVSRHGSGYDWDFTITRGDGSTKTLQIPCSDIYTAARSGYTLGTFTLASVTLQVASSVLCYREIEGTGTYYYTAGTTVTVYPGDGGSFTPQGSAYGDITPIGTPVWFKQHSKTETPTGTWYTYHTSDPGGTTYKRFAAGAVIKNLRNPGSGTKYARGTGYDITPISNTKLRLTATYLFPAGSTDSTHYYTKS